MPKEEESRRYVFFPDFYDMMKKYGKRLSRKEKNIMKNTEINIRDPFVLAENGTYYMYGDEAATCWMAATGFDCYVSEDMENWDGPYEVFRKPEDFWADMNCWARKYINTRGLLHVCNI